MVLLGGSDDESTTYLRGTDLLPVLESAVEHMLEECQKPENHKMKPENLMSMLATWLKEHNPKRDPEMAAKVAEMHDALAAEAAAAAVMMENATKVQASVRGRQARLKAKGTRQTLRRPRHLRRRPRRRPKPWRRRRECRRASVGDRRALN